VGGGEGFGDLHDRSVAVFVQRFPQNVSRVVNKGKEGIERTQRRFSATAVGGGWEIRVVADRRPWPIARVDCPICAL